MVIHTHIHTHIHLFKYACKDVCLTISGSQSIQQRKTGPQWGKCLADTVSGLYRLAGRV